MVVPGWLEKVLPGHTAHAWEVLAGILPPHAYLGGGTGIAVHLQHRLSRDLDVFFEEPPPMDELEAALRERGPLVTTRKESGTLDCILGDTKVQLLDASHCNLVEAAREVGGIRVAGLGDLIAMKLRAITDRGAHRDYLDLAAIELDGHRRAEEGIAYFVARFEPRNADEAVATVLRSLAYLGDLEDDPAVAVSIEELQGYWRRRIPQIAGHLSRFGSGYPHLDVGVAAGADIEALAIAQLGGLDQATASGTIGPHRPVNGNCKARTKKRRRCPFDALAGGSACGMHGRAGQ